MQAGLLTAGLLLGLALRVLFFHRPGTFDVPFWESWAESVRKHGLLAAYTGNLYPLQWGLFGLADVVARDIGASFAEVLKALDLMFDLGNLLLLGLLLRRIGRRFEWALLYWLGPYFLVIDWLGYVDPQMTFFVLATLALLGADRSSRTSALAGVPLAVALLMKPQALILAAMLVAYAVARRVLANEWDAASRAAVSLLVAPVCGFLLLSGAFWVAGRSPTLLAHTYLHPARASQAVVAQMPNIWYPIKALYSLRVHVGFIVRHPHFFYVVAAIATAAMLLWAVIGVARRGAQWPWELVVLALFAAGSAVQPMLFASAHENHFFVAATLVPLLLLRFGSVDALLAVTASLLLQAINIVGLYGLGGSPRSAPQPLKWLVSHYTPITLLAIAIANTLIFGAGAWAAMRRIAEAAHRGRVAAG